MRARTMEIGANGNSEYPVDAAASATHQEFRKAMRNVPTTITIVSVLCGDQPVGMVVGTFTSVSLTPLLVGFLGDNGSSTLRRIRTFDRWSFSILCEEDAAVVDAFRGPIENRFAALDWVVSDSGTPILPSAVVTFETMKYDIVSTGDHDLFLAQVVGIHHGRPNARPLVYFRGRMTGLDPYEVPDYTHWQLGWGA